MKRIFSLASGNMWQWTTSKNRNVLINYARKLDISGFEITFGFKEEVYAFKLSKENRAWLKQLDYVTIHAPFYLVKESEKEAIKQLDAISKIYYDIDAKDVIIHPPALPSSKILKKYDFNVSTENMLPKCCVNLSDLRRILNKNPKMRLCLDVSHAYKCSKYETGKLVKAFKDKISQIHLSGTYRKKNHQSLRKVTKNFLFSIEPIKKLNIPIVIEEDIEVKSLKYLREEIEYIKRIFD